jgi:hypothetical protein
MLEVRTSWLVHFAAFPTRVEPLLPLFTNHRQLSLECLYVSLGIEKVESRCFLRRVFAPLMLPIR